MEKLSKYFLSYSFKNNRAAFRSAIIKNDRKKLLRYIKAERLYLCLKLDEFGNTALLLAIQYGSPAIVRFFLEHNAHPDQPNFLTFQTPLGLLASTNFTTDQIDHNELAVEIANILFEHGAYVDKCSTYVLKDHCGNESIAVETPLMSAVRTGNLPMATLLVEKKANLNYTEKTSGLRPIHYAVSNGDVKMFDLLENAGAACRSVVGANENTLLHCFCSSPNNDQNLPLLKRLINLGCDINAVNNDQQTPLMFAAKFNMINTCRYLLHFDDIRLDSVDMNGERAIDFASKQTECWTLLDQAANGLLRRHRSSPSTRDLFIGTNSMKISRRNLYRNSFQQFSTTRTDADDGSNDQTDMKYAKMLEELQEKEARANPRCS